MSSYICGANVAYDLCYNGIECGYWYGNWGAGTEWNNQEDGNDSMSLLKLRTYDASERGAVVVYNDANCNGASGRYYANKDPKLDSTYTYSEFKASNGRNDSVSAVRVPYGYTAHFFEHDGFQGKEWVVEGSMPTQSDDGWECVNAPAEYDEMISSMKISHTDGIGEAYGHWVGITGTE